ncbi:MAG: TatD family hydrolase [Leptospirales bacterium]|nr:TatD family hydrolase [Leptospirales bacterium]
MFDTHCHLDLVEAQGIDADQALKNAGRAGLQGVVQISVDLKAARWNCALGLRAAEIQEAPPLYWTVGLHPESAAQIAELDEIFALAREHRNHPRFMGLGETGLDYFHSREHEAQQKQSLERHFALAQELALPVVLHLRDDRNYNPERIATALDSLEILKNFPRVAGVLHCYTYTEAEALPFVERGWYVSYSGVLTFKNAVAVQQGAVRLPLERLLVETDAPFLAPAPHRGQTNQPAYVRHTLDFLANLRAEKCGEDPEMVRACVIENCKRFVQLKEELRAA